MLIPNLIDVKNLCYNKEYNKVARLHKYWSRKPWYVIEHYVKKFAKPGDVILDPFCGSGSVGLEAILNGSRFVGYDLNPIAIFITEKTLNLDFDSEVFDEEYLSLIKDIKSEIMDIYKLDKPQGLYIKYLIAGDSSSKDYNCVATNYSFRKKEYLTVCDEVLRGDFNIPESVSFPDKAFPKRFYKDRFSYKGVNNVSDMFSSRNLLALSILHNYIIKSKFNYKFLFLLAFSNTLLHVSKLKGENVRPLGVNNYWIPNDYIEENVIWRFEDRIKNLKDAKIAVCKRRYEKELKSVPDYTLYNKSSLKLSEIADETIDYIITDPPYGDAIQYSELSYIWNCWLKKDFPIQNEVIINPVQDKGIKEFHGTISEFLLNAKRTLRKNAYLTLCFQNKTLEVWLGIIQSINKVGFTLHDIEVYDTFGSPYNKHWAKFSPKSDFYVTFKNCRKKVCDIKGTICPSSIIRDIGDYLEANNGAVFDINKAYDLFVAAVIQNTFDGYEIANTDKFNLKQIINMFEGYKNNGNKQETSNRSFQMQLPF